MELLKGVVESRQESIMEEFTKMLVQGEFNGEDAINLYFSKDVESGIKFAIIRFTTRNTLLDIYMKEDDENYTKSIRWRLKELYPDEVKTILFSDDKDMHKKDAFFFAINFVDAKTILEYLKLHPDLDSFYLSEFLGRLLKVEISQDVADEILLLDICSDFEKSVVDHLILKASTLTLIKCLCEKRDYFVEEQLNKMEEIFLNSTITEETADYVLSRESLDEKYKEWVIKYASKKAVLSFYPKQSSYLILEECFKKLEELYSPLNTLAKDIL